jgi:hypothetical protein
MSIVAASPSSIAPPTTAPVSDQSVQECVQEVFRQHRPRPLVGDRRCDRREPFPYPIHVTPLATDGKILLNDTFVVLGKHLSERGLDFYYQAPVPYRRVITSWECRDGSWLGLLLDLRWCRCTRYGWYENGGRFLQVVPSPVPGMRGASPAGIPEQEPQT